MCRCCPSGIASGTTPTAAHTAVLRYAPKSQQSNPPDCVPLVEGCGSSSLSEERRSQKRDASSPEVFTRSAPIREAAFQPAELAGDGDQWSPLAWTGLPQVDSWASVVRQPTLYTLLKRSSTLTPCSEERKILAAFIVSTLLQEFPPCRGQNN